jgi:hypothetical protein
MAECGGSGKEKWDQAMKVNANGFPRRVAVQRLVP